MLHNILCTKCIIVIFIHVGLKFWKVGSRKLYAVKESELKETKKRSSTSSGIINISSSDSDSEIIPLVKRKRVSMDSIKLQRIQDDIREVKEELSKMFLLTSTMQVPIALRRLLYDTFRCSICRSTPMKPPIIFARCCKSVIGCQACVDTWYRGEEGQQRTCPNCREARAYVDTCKINGLDDFLTGIAPLLEFDSIDDNEDENDV